MLIGFYQPGRSVVHRAPAGLKLAMLAVGLIALAMWRRPLPLTGAAVAVLAVAALSGVRARILAAQIRPVLWAAALFGLMQLWATGPLAAALTVGYLLVAVAAAGMVTLTTPTNDILDASVAVLRPLRRLGVDPERIGLVLVLTIRAVPVLTGLAAEVQQARRARGAGRSVRALAVPLAIRTVRYADRLGEALVARGVDDPAP